MITFFGLLFFLFGGLGLYLLLFAPGTEATHVVGGLFLVVAMLGAIGSDLAQQTRRIAAALEKARPPE